MISILTYFSLFVYLLLKIIMFCLQVQEQNYEKLLRSLFYLQIDSESNQLNNGFDNYVEVNLEGQLITINT